MTRVLVTGASGQLGMAIKAASVDYPEIDFVFTTKQRLDITNLSMLSLFWKKYSFDYCINCAAFTDVVRAEQEPETANHINAEGVKLLAEKCRQNHCILIHISTDYVFDGEKEGAYLPIDPPNPINEYGRSKLLGEEFISETLKEYFIVRTSWLYSEYGKNFYTTILEKSRTEKEIYVTNRQIGCPTHAGNLARFLLRLIKDKDRHFGILHYSDGEPMTWYDFAIKIIRENQLEDKTKVLPSQNEHDTIRRPRNSVLLS